MVTDFCSDTVKWNYRARLFWWWATHYDSSHLPAYNAAAFTIPRSVLQAVTGVASAMSVRFTVTAMLPDRTLPSEASSVSE